MKKLAIPQRNTSRYNHYKKNQKPIDEVILNRLKQVLPHLSKTRRILLLHLFFKIPNTTGRFCHACKVENLSDMADKINPLLKTYGLAINNYPLATPLVNSFQGETLVHCWELATLDVKEIQ